MDSGLLPVPPLTKLALSELPKLIADDELCLILAGNHSAATAGLRPLLADSVAALYRESHYASLHCGFLKAGGRAPYAVLSWKTPPPSSLEARWLAHKLCEGLRTSFAALKRLAVVFAEPAADTLHLAIAEDYVARSYNATYEQSVYTSVRFFSPESQRLVDSDPFREQRFARQLAFRAAINENPDSLTSLALASRIEDFTKRHGLGFECFDERELREMGMNLLCAVGQASTRSPSRLIIATANLKPNVQPLLLLGKGITFDTGGINLKAHENFVNCMKNDMGGAGLMAQLFMALIETGYKQPLVLAIPACENLIDGLAMKPGAIIKSYAGLSVIIEHTDAEGRLILADALHYAQKRFQPHETLTAATLTTAALRQFSGYFTPVHFASAALQQRLAEAGAASGEGFSFWGEFLPFLEGNKSSAADLTNMGRLPQHAHIGGGSNVAAHFLRQFAVAPMTHIDIFASTWNWSGDYPGAHYGATGAPFNSLFRLLR